jgi:beta-1,4-mannosyl-glycoprotein beta-1,4-N-acetylglucosaminyltransferase
MFNLRYKILENQVDYFVVCESLYDHKGQFKDKKFIFKNDFDENKIKYILLDKPFPKKNNGWENQALQRDYLLDNLDFASEEDYIFFSDPDEIVKPEILNNFELSKKYGIFLQNVFNYKFNLYNRYESPWEGTRVSKKKNLKSIDYMRQKVKLKNLKYSLYRIDKEKNIEIFDDAGWHFNNIMTPEEISLKLKTFAHTEYSSERYSSVDVIKKKINNKVDLFERGHEYQVLKLNEDFPEYILENLEKYGEFIIK